MNFYHSGSMGDIIYSIPAVKLLGGGTYYLKKGNHYNALHTLLRTLPFVDDVICTSRQKPTVEYFDLDQYRVIYYKNKNWHLAKCHCELTGIKYDLSVPWLEVEPIHKAEIIINRTKRYNEDGIQWELLKDYADCVLFVGFKKEWNAFCVS